MCPGPELRSCLCQKSCSVQHLKGLWHSSTLDYLWGHRAHYQWRQRCFTGNGSPVFAELEECDKVLRATAPQGSHLLPKLTEPGWWAAYVQIYTQAAFPQNGALAHKCINVHGSCLLSDWEVRVEISGSLHNWVEEEVKTDMKWDERWSWGGWRRWSLPQACTDLPTGEWPKPRHEYTHSHLLKQCQCGSCQAGFPSFSCLSTNHTDGK